MTPNPTGPDEAQLELLQSSVEEWNDYRRKNPDDAINLREADLRLWPLQGADLRFADLSGANLFRASLTEANLLEAVLVGANLEMTHQYEADLRGANLSDANLTNANLSRANLEAATLLETNLSGTVLSMVRLTSVRSGSITGVPGSLPVSWQFMDGYLLGPSANLAGADMRGVDLRGNDDGLVDLRDAILTRTDLTGALFDRATLWPRGFDPVAAGAVEAG